METERQLSISINLCWEELLCWCWISQCCKKKGGPCLHKLNSNEKAVLDCIDPSERAAIIEPLGLDPTPAEHALGIQWSLKDDTCSWKTSLQPVGVSCLSLPLCLRLDHRLETWFGHKMTWRSMYLQVSLGVYKAAALLFSHLLLDPIFSYPPFSSSLLWCNSCNLAFIVKFNLSWKHPAFFHPDGIHPNGLGSRTLTDNYFYSIW